MKKRWLPLIFVGLIAFNIILSLSASLLMARPAYAVDAGALDPSVIKGADFVNAYNIVLHTTFGDAIFFDKNPGDGTYDYSQMVGGNSGVCKDNAYFKITDTAKNLPPLYQPSIDHLADSVNRPLNAEVDVNITDPAAPNAGCKEVDGKGKKVTITVGTIANSKLYYEYKNADTIQKIDGSATFTRDATDPTIFFADYDKNASNCKDFLLIGNNGSGFRYFDISPPPESRSGYEKPIDYQKTYGDGCRFNSLDNYNNRSVSYPGSAGPGQWSFDPIGSMGAASTPGTGTTSSGASGTNGKDSCTNSGKQLSWLLCPLLDLASSFLLQVDRQLVRLLTLDSQYYANDQVAMAWARMRNIAYIILVPIMLVMILSTAMGFEFISAYTMKKALPRLVIAVLFIALSLEISRFLIILTNDVGKGVLGLVTNAFGGGNGGLASLFDPNGGESLAFFSVLFGAGVFALGIIPVLLLYLVSAGLVILIALFALVFRQILLITFMVLSPLAILAWIFPGNDKLWKLWWSSFSKLLLLYPLIMLLIGTGRGFASLVQDTGTSVGGPDIFSTVLKLTAYIAPYFFIPAAFKFAGGAFATITGMANDRSKGVFDRLKKGRQKAFGNAMERGKAGNYYKGGKYNADGTAKNLRGLLSQGFQAASSVPQTGFRPTNVRRGMANNNFQRALKMAQESEEFQAYKDDAIAQAHRFGKGDRKLTEDHLAQLSPTQFAYGDDNTAEGRKTNAARKEALENIMSVHRKHGQAGNIAALIAGEFSSSTAFKNTEIFKKDEDGNDVLGEDGKRIVVGHKNDAHAKFLNAIDDVAGKNSILGVQLIAKGRAMQEQAGRVDVGGVSFSKSVVGLNKVHTANNDGSDKEVQEYVVEEKQANGTVIRRKVKREYSGNMEEVNEAAMEDLIEGKSWQQIVQSGKKEVAISLAPVRAQLTQKRIEAVRQQTDGSIQQAEADIQALEANTSIPTEVKQEQVQARRQQVNALKEQRSKEVIKFIAQEQQAHIAAAGSSSAQAGEFGDKVFSAPFPMDILPPDLRDEITKRVEPVIQADGKPKMEPDPTPGKEGQYRPVRREVTDTNLTHGQVYDRLRGNVWWQSYVKEYGAAAAAAGAATPGVPPPEAAAHEAGATAGPDAGAG